MIRSYEQQITIQYPGRLNSTRIINLEASDAGPRVLLTSHGTNCQVILFEARCGLQMELPPEQ